MYKFGQIEIIWLLGKRGFAFFLDGGSRKLPTPNAMVDSFYTTNNEQLSINNCIVPSSSNRITNEFELVRWLCNPLVSHFVVKQVCFMSVYLFIYLSFFLAGAYQFLKCCSEHAYPCKFSFFSLKEAHSILMLLSDKCFLIA